MTAYTLYPPNSSVCTMDWITTNLWQLLCSLEMKLQRREPGLLYQSIISTVVQDSYRERCEENNQQELSFHSSCCKKWQSSSSTQEIFVHRVFHACSRNKKQKCISNASSGQKTEVLTNSDCQKTCSSWFKTVVGWTVIFWQFIQRTSCMKSEKSLENMNTWETGRRDISFLTLCYFLIEKIWSCHWHIICRRRRI